MKTTDVKAAATDIVAEPITLTANKTVELNGKSLPEFKLTITNQKTLSNILKNVLIFEKVFIAEDRYNPDETKRNEKIMIVSRKVFMINDKDALEAFLIDDNEDSDANQLSGKLYFLDEDSKASPSCAVGRGILTYGKSSSVTIQ